MREVGVIDNATYRQLDSSITHARARLEIHKLCDLGFLEKKGQGRNTYYIRTSKLVSLVERLPPQDERLRPQDERLLPQHGTLGERLPPQHGTLEEKIPPQGKMYHGKHGTFEIESQPKSRNELLRELPKGIEERVAKLGNRASRERVSQLLVDLCAFKPYSNEELALIIRVSSSLFLKTSWKHPC